MEENLIMMLSQKDCQQNAISISTLTHFSLDGNNLSQKGHKIKLSEAKQYFHI